MSFVLAALSRPTSGAGDEVIQVGERFGREDHRLGRGGSLTTEVVL